MLALQREGFLSVWFIAVYPIPSTIPGTSLALKYLWNAHMKRMNDFDLERNIVRRQILALLLTFFYLVHKEMTKRERPQKGRVNHKSSFSGFARDWHGAIIVMGWGRC